MIEDCVSLSFGECKNCEYFLSNLRLDVSVALEAFFSLHVGVPVHIRAALVHTHPLVTSLGVCASFIELLVMIHTGGKIFRENSRTCACVTFAGVYVMRVPRATCLGVCVCDVCVHGLVRA